MCREQPVAPQQKRAHRHQQREPRPQAGHDVVGVIQQRQRSRPLVVWNLVESLHFGFGRSIDDEAQRIVDDDRVVYLMCLLVGLADKHHPCAGLSVEQALHCRDGGGLVARDIFAM